MMHPQTVLYQSPRPRTTTSGKKPREKRIRLTERDLAVLYELLIARYLTTLQIAALFWRSGHSVRGRLYACQRRLLQLTQQGLLRRIEVPVRRGEAPEPYIYALGKVGAEILISEIGIEPKDVDWKPKSAEANFPFLDHLIATNDLKIALLQACEGREIQLTNWLYEKELKSENMKDYVMLTSADGKTQKAAVVPDAYFVLQGGGRLGHLFVEIDLGTVTIEPTVWEKRGWARKVRTYLAYYESGKFQMRYGGRAFRVLCVSTSAARLQNLRATTQRENGGRIFLFSTFEQLTAETVLSQPVWTSAGGDTPESILG